MSIINEALKKAQQERDRKTGSSSFAKLVRSPNPPSETPPLGNSAAGVEQKAPKRNKKTVAIATMAAGIVLSTALFFILKPPAKKNIAAQSPGPPPVTILPADEKAAIKKVQNAQRALPRKPAIADEKDLVLNGIVYDEAKPLAIINQTILAEGESFGKVTVVKIEPEQVTIEVDGKTSYLNLK